MLGSAKSKSVSVSTLIVLLPFDSLADGPKIDHFSHVVILEVTGYVSVQRQDLGNIVGKCADT
jgi:hypothetical protein